MAHKRKHFIMKVHFIGKRDKDEVFKSKSFRGSINLAEDSGAKWIGETLLEAKKKKKDVFIWE